MDIHSVQDDRKAIIKSNKFIELMTFILAIWHFLLAFQSMTLLD